MIVYRFELKKQLKSTLAWTSVITLVLWLLLYGFYPLFLDSRKAMESMMSAFSPKVIAAMGFDLGDFFSFQSFFGMVYLYEIILAAIMATVVGVTLFAREKQNKCQDFLFSKPISRDSLFFQKLLCGLTLILLMNIPYILLFAYSYFDYTATDSLTAPVVLSALSLFLTQVLFLALGMFLGVYLQRVRSLGILGVSIGMFAFLLSIVYSLTEKEGLKFISPLYYFNPKTVMNTGSYDLPCVITAFILIVGVTIAGYVRYIKADIPSV